MVSQVAIPVRWIQRTLRQLVTEIDPNYVRDSQIEPEYKFKGRTFEGRSNNRGPYES